MKYYMEVNMKILRKTFILIMIIIMSIRLTNSFKPNIFASSTLNTNYKRNVVNVGVLWTNLDNPFMKLINKGLKYIENKTENKVRFTSYDGTNNIAIQYDQLDSLLRSNINLLVNTKEDTVKNVIDKVTEKNIPVIFLNVDPSIAAKFSEYYKNKIVFMAEDFRKPAMLQSKIIVDAWNANRQNIDKNGDKSKNILVVGFDGLPEAKDLIDKGMMTGTITQDPTTVSEALYTIGMNLVNNVDPLENTNYKLGSAGIVVEFPHYEYINKS